MISFFYVVSYCQLSATLQTMSIIVVNLQDNRVVFRNFYRTFKVYIWLSLLKILYKINHILYIINLIRPFKIVISSTFFE